MTMTSRQESIFGQTVSINFQLGMATSSAGIDSSFAVTSNSLAPSFTLILNEATGAWAFTWGGGTLATGTLTTPQLTAALLVFHGPLTALRDYADYFVMMFVPEIPCTQPTLWGAGDL